MNGGVNIGPGQLRVIALEGPPRLHPKQHQATPSTMVGRQRISMSQLAQIGFLLIPLLLQVIALLFYIAIVGITLNIRVFKFRSRKSVIDIRPFMIGSQTGITPNCR